MDLPFGLTPSQLKGALRLALQSAFAAIGAYGLLQALGIPEVFVGVLSAVLVVGPSIGNTFSEAKGRIVSTLVGSAIGFVLVSFMPWGVGTAVSLGLCMFVINMIAHFKPSWRYGVVAAVAIALGSENNTITMTLNRLISIGIGVTVGIFVSLSVLPDKAEDRARRYLRRALRNASRRFEIAVANTRVAKEEQEDSGETADNFYTNLSYAKGAAQAIKFNKDQSIILQQIENTEKLYNSILIIHRVADQSEKGVSDEEAGIEENAEELKEMACSLIKQLANQEQKQDIDLEEFTQLVQTTQKNINTNANNKEVNIRRHTFIFGLTEIRDSIHHLLECLQEESK